jgi:hypothetical protein
VNKTKRREYKMKTLKDMNMAELKELHNHWKELYSQYGAENFRQNALEVEEEYLSRVAETEEIEPKVIEVFFEYGYKWSVHVMGEEESRDTNITKVEAMYLARKVRKELGNAVIKEQKLTRTERAENMSWLHQNTETFAM